MPPKIASAFCFVIAIARCPKNAAVQKIDPEGGGVENFVAAERERGMRALGMRPTPPSGAGGAADVESSPLVAPLPKAIAPAVNAPATHEEIALSHEFVFLRTAR